MNIKSRAPFSGPVSRGAGKHRGRASNFTQCKFAKAIATQWLFPDDAKAWARVLAIGGILTDEERSHCIDVAEAVFWRPEIANFRRGMSNV
jgi:hypothetical protein